MGYFKRRRSMHDDQSHYIYSARSIDQSAKKSLSRTRECKSARTPCTQVASPSYRSQSLQPTTLLLGRVPPPVPCQRTPGSTHTVPSTAGSWGTMWRYLQAGSSVDRAFSERARGVHISGRGQTRPNFCISLCLGACLVPKNFAKFFRFPVTSNL